MPKTEKLLLWSIIVAVLLIIFLGIAFRKNIEEAPSISPPDKLSQEVENYKHQNVPPNTKG